MRKSRILLTGLIILLGAVIGLCIYLPKTVDTALSRIDYPFEVGEILTTQQIDENTIVAIYTNKEKNSELQNAVLRKNGIFYRVAERNGSLKIEEPEKLESGELRAEMLISWYDKSDKYVVMAAAYDEDVVSINYSGQELKPLNVNGYRIFYGWGSGEYEVYELFDKNGNLLEHIKE